eukprot:TRINITY_DN9788_c0_g2_i1.p1 TRINITY_DN9788_c0_g2~~TRINITY_DN9788_c0_g2_i1.p1  ORF type:complete len:158 (+),score=27.26 TRINITY_DN9788_c0_g2_i1:360-833(+)
MYVEMMCNLFEQAGLPTPEYHTTRVGSAQNPLYESVFMCSFIAIGSDFTAPAALSAIEEAAKDGWDYLHEAFGVSSALSDDQAMPLLLEKLRERVLQGRIPTGRFFSGVKSRLEQAREMRHLLRQENKSLRRMCQFHLRNSLGQEPAQLASLLLSSS